LAAVDRFRVVVVDGVLVARLRPAVASVPRLAVVAELADLAVLAGVAAAAVPEPPASDAAAVTAGAALAAGAGADVAAADPDAADARVPAVRVVRARGFAAVRGLALARGLLDRAVPRDADGAWSRRIPAIRALSSAISSRTSARREVRFSRVFFVALSSRPTRHVSSDRAAAKANSSQSMWRARAAAGVIAAAAAVGLGPVVADPVPEALLPVFALASVMSSPSCVPLRILAHDGRRRDRRLPLATR